MTEDVDRFAESSGAGNRPEYPPFMRGSAESSAKEGLGVPALAFPHLKPTVIVGSEPEERGVQKRSGGRRPHKASMWRGGANSGARIARRGVSLGAKAPGAIVAPLK